MEARSGLCGREAVIPRTILRKSFCIYHSQKKELRLTRFSDRYANFAFGDETNKAIYGTSLAKLKTLKKKYDPRGVFNQWFPIQA